MSELRHGQTDEIGGYLFKEGKRLKARTRRYLTLVGSTFSHHMKEGQPATWEVNINDVNVALGDRPMEFVISAGGRSLSFFAETPQELEMWMKALKAASSSVEDFYTLGKVVGKGSYGEVFIAKDKQTKELCAVKIIRKNPSNRKQKKFIERETTIMTKVDHQHIVKTYDVFEGPSRLAIVSEYMKGGELFDLIIESQYFTEDKARLIMKQILEGVQYLHRHSIVHRDIKPENVLCTGTEWPLHVKLTDFGLSNFIDGDEVDNAAALMSHVGTSYYLAPEVVGKEGYAFPVDLWACGVVLYIMLCGRFPFWGKTDIEYMNSLSHGPSMVGDGWADVSDEGKQFLKDLLHLNPKRRLTADEALAHPWIQGTPETEGRMQRKLSSINGLAALRSEQKNLRETSDGAHARMSDITNDSKTTSKSDGIPMKADSENMDSNVEA